METEIKCGNCGFVHEIKFRVGNRTAGPPSYVVCACGEKVCSIPVGYSVRIASGKFYDPALDPRWTGDMA
jgi:hypothetical protein